MGIPKLLRLKYFLGNTSIGATLEFPNNMPLTKLLGFAYKRLCIIFPFPFPFPFPFDHVSLNRDYIERLYIVIIYRERSYIYICILYRARLYI